MLVDNAPIGTTDGQGFLKRDGLAAGTHFVKIHKEGYGDEQRTVSLPPGQAQALNLVLAPLPGKLTISPSIPDADVVVAGRSYHGQVSDLQLAAGQYPVTVSKTGFKSDTRTVTVAPGRVQNVDVTLQPLSSQEQLGSIEKKYQAKDFDGVISDGRGLLATQPQNSKLNLMIGSALYSKGSIAASTSYFSTAIDLGDTVKLQGKHHHGGLGGGDFLNGILSFSKGGFAWHETDGTGDDFSVAASKIYSIKTQPENTAQVSIQVGIAKGDKEDKKRYDWRPAWTQITVTNPGQPIPIKSVTCAGAICDQWMNLIADLARKLKQ